ncbi:MAG: hypothetical protein A4E35_01820 [Methanoregula sp. PtaU1.Bin051]|nr:MAG: hypothetical protein A4E35_01820 [Methanoregula sp. PtaU1.Bin051]
MGKGSKQMRELAKKAPPQIEPGQTENIISNRYYLGLAGIFIVGVFLRLFELARRPLWLDEASTNYLVTQPDLAAVFTAASADHHAPLHFMTIWFVKIFGSSEFLLRLPSAIAGAFTVIVIFFIAKELYNEEAGIISAAFLAFSPFHILYSQEARMYGMVVLFVALAIWMFFRAARTGSLWDWLFFGASCALAFSTHFYSAFVIVALILGYFILRSDEFRIKRTQDGENTIPVSLPHDLKNFLAGLAFAGVLVLPVMGSFFGQSGYFVSRSFNWGLSMWSIPSETFLDFSYYIEFIAILFVCLMLVGFVMIWMQKKQQAVAVAVILFVPMGISLYLSQIIPFNVRYHLYLIVLFLALVAIPLAYLSRKINSRHGALLIIGAILALSIIPLLSYYSAPLQEDWRTFSNNLRETTQPGDNIAPLPWYIYLPLSYYYDNSSDGTFYKNFALDESGFLSLENTTGSVYYVVTWDITAADPTGYSVQYLNEHTAKMPGGVSGILLLKKSHNCFSL